MCTVNHFEWSCHLVAEPPGARADHRVSCPVLSWSQQRDLTRRRGRVVQARACKALYMGSIPIVASQLRVAQPAVYHEYQTGCPRSCLRTEVEYDACIDVAVLDGLHRLVDLVDVP